MLLIKCPGNTVGEYLTYLVKFHLLRFPPPQSIYFLRLIFTFLILLRYTFLENITIYYYIIFISIKKLRNIF